MSGRLRSSGWHPRGTGCDVPVYAQAPATFMGRWGFSRKEVNTMMDMSSVIDAGLVLMGCLAVLMVGLGSLSSESVSGSSTVSTSHESSYRRSEPAEIPLRKAA